jgi:hypothetical protein
VVERSRIPEPAGGGASPPSAVRSTGRKRRLLDTPANDNRPTPGQRLLRAAIFVVIGSALAWLLREILG